MTEFRAWPAILHMEIILEKLAPSILLISFRILRRIYTTATAMTKLMPADSFEKLQNIKNGGSRLGNRFRVDTKLYSPDLSFLI